METKAFTFILKATLLSVFLLLSFITASKPIQALSISNLEQQINILTGEFSTTASSPSPTSNGLGIISYDSAQYTSPTIYFEAVIRCASCSGGGNNRTSAGLYDTDGNLVAGSAITTTSSTYQVIRSAAITPANDNYSVRFFRDDDTGTAFIKAARLIIVQSTTSLTDTQTQIEVGNYENSTSTSATSLTAPKYYQFDQDQYSGTTNAYFEATLHSDANSTTATYYFNNYDSGSQEWDTSPGQMVDNNTSTYASTTTDNQVQLLTTNTNSGSDLGQITTVEVRAFTYQDTGSSGTIDLRPVFSGGDGTNHNFAPPSGSGNAAWSSYFDITTDPNAPSSWSWSDVQSLDLDVEFNSGGAGNTGLVSKVEVRVTYDDNTNFAYAQLYNRTNSAIVGNSTISTSRSTSQIVRSSALSTNWDTGNDDEYEVRIYTNNASNAVYLSNAKIIVDQTDSDGINQVEVIHAHINTNRTQTNTSYTQDSYYNQFAPYNFASNNLFNVYFEATIRTTGSTGYAALYNYSDTDIIDTSTTSELSTTSTSFERATSANLALNSDWPTSLKTLDTILRASTSETVTVSSSWLRIQHGTIDPEIELTIAGVASGQTNNGITSSVTTTPTLIPFGNLEYNTPKYATQQLTISTNDASSTTSVYVALSSPLQGEYPANHIDEFTGSSATWSDPQNWLSPTGVSPNSDTGWIGANTSDTDVPGWSSGSAKFGPLGTTSVEVLRTESLSDSVYVSFGIEVNILQPADSYFGTLQYNVIPTF